MNTVNSFQENRNCADIAVQVDIKSENWREYQKQRYYQKHDEIIVCKKCQLQMIYYQLRGHNKKCHDKVYHCDLCNFDTVDIWKHRQTDKHQRRKIEN